MTDFYGTSRMEPLIQYIVLTKLDDGKYKHEDKEVVFAVTISNKDQIDYLRVYHGPHKK